MTTNEKGEIIVATHNSIEPENDPSSLVLPWVETAPWVCSPEEWDKRKKYIQSVAELTLQACRHVLDYKIDPGLYEDLGNRFKQYDQIDETTREIKVPILSHRDTRFFEKQHQSLARESGLFATRGTVMFTEYLGPYVDEDLDGKIYRRLRKRENVGREVGYTKAISRITALQPGRAAEVRERHSRLASYNDISPNFGLIFFRNYLHLWMLEIEKEVMCELQVKGEESHRA